MTYNEKYDSFRTYFREEKPGTHGDPSRMRDPPHKYPAILPGAALRPTSNPPFLPHLFLYYQDREKPPLLRSGLHHMLLC